MNHDDVVIVAAARTPQGRLKGQLAPLTAVQLGSIAIRGALAQGGVSAGCRRRRARRAGAARRRRARTPHARPPWVPASRGPCTRRRSTRCASRASRAIIDGARMIAVGDATVVVAAGMESMTRSPHLLMGSRDGWAYGSVEVLDHMAYDGLTDAYDRESMGASTERHNDRFEITREMQDAVAARSHQRAAAATDAGVFDAEIVPVEIPQRKGDPVVVTKDEGIRPDTTVESLAGLRAAFAEGGSITAGNSSQISDGASAVVLTTRSHADENGWPVLAVVGASGQVAGPDNSLHAQPARAIEKALEKQGIAASDLDMVEINEAFGAVVARSQQELGLSDDVVNPHGGGIAIGHPIGASGNRLVVHAVHELVRRGERHGRRRAVRRRRSGRRADPHALTDSAHAAVSAHEVRQLCAYSPVANRKSAESTRTCEPFGLRTTAAHRGSRAVRRQAASMRRCLYSFLAFLAMGESPGMCLPCVARRVSTTAPMARVRVMMSRSEPWSTPGERHRASTSPATLRSPRRRTSSTGSGASRPPDEKWL